MDFSSKHILILLCLLLNLAYSKPVSESFPLKDKGSYGLELSDDTMSENDTVELRLSAEIPEGDTVEFEYDDLEKQFWIEKVETPPPALTSKNLMLHRKILQISPNVVQDGKTALPKIKFKINHTKQKSEEIGETETKILSVTEEKITDDLQEPKLQMRLHPPRPWWHWGVAILIIAGILLLFWYWYRYHKKHLPPPPPIPPHIIALQRLKELQDENLWEKKLIMEFYNRIQNILRDYIEQRFAIQAPERTTEEFLLELHSALPRLPELAKQQPLLKAFLNHCDLVRFAKQSPTQQDMERLHSDCHAFIQATIPAPIPLK